MRRCKHCTSTGTHYPKVILQIETGELMSRSFEHPTCSEHMSPFAERYVTALEMTALAREFSKGYSGILPDESLTRVEFVPWESSEGAEFAAWLIRSKERKKINDRLGGIRVQPMTEEEIAHLHAEAGKLLEES